MGKAAWLATLAEFYRCTGRPLLSVVATIAGADRGAMIAREMLLRNGQPIEVERALVYTVRMVC